MTKKEYNQPTLTVYGGVEELTQSSGSTTAADTFNITGLVGDLDDISTQDSGSVDATLDLGN